MATITLNVTTRNAGKANALRQEGKLPAVVYGRSTDAKPVAVDAAVFKSVFRESGKTAPILLTIDDADPVRVLVKDISRNPVTDRIIHVDFHQVAMGEVVRARLPITFVGVAPAVKLTGGVFVALHSYVEVRTTAETLVRDVVVDVTVLKTNEDAIRVSDLPIPEGIEVLMAPDIIVAKVATVRRAAEEDPDQVGAAKKEGDAEPEQGKEEKKEEA
ncbi:MAG: 50S ribosomal protein L25 [Candidatus Uhrbacteria bacterium]